ncbi:MAG: hypothetical protein A2Y78_08375 [Acidobacteria bacterium RBG_13_68_16]|nr:MAG: hypothetical protein A2Y78_08375 [Acidobacteria bacterium RBG_13_68_16]
MTLNILDPASPRHILHVPPNPLWDPLPLMGKLGVPSFAIRSVNGDSRTLKGLEGGDLEDQQIHYVVHYQGGIRFFTLVRTDEPSALRALTLLTFSPADGTPPTRSILVHETTEALEAAITAEWNALREHRDAKTKANTDLDPEQIRATLKAYFNEVDDIADHAYRMEKTLRRLSTTFSYHVESVGLYLHKTLAPEVLLRALEPAYYHGNSKPDRPHLIRHVANIIADPNASPGVIEAARFVVKRTTGALAYFLAARILADLRFRRHTKPTATDATCDTPKPAYPKGDPHDWAIIIHPDGDTWV